MQLNVILFYIYNSNLSQTFLNCLFLDFSVIDLTSYPVFIWIKIGLKLQINFDVRMPGGWGCSVSDFRHPRMRREGGGGGQKSATFCRSPSWMAPR